MACRVNRAAASKAAANRSPVSKSRSPDRVASRAAERVASKTPDRAAKVVKAADSADPVEVGVPALAPGFLF